MAFCRGHPIGVEGNSKETHKGERSEDIYIKMFSELSDPPGRNMSLNFHLTLHYLADEVKLDPALETYKLTVEANS